MDLKTYLIARDGRLHREGDALIRLAQFCEVSPYYLYMVAAGNKKPGAELAANLEYATRKKVNRRVTLSTFPWDRPSKKSVQATS